MVSKSCFQVLRRRPSSTITLSSSSSQHSCSSYYELNPKKKKGIFQYPWFLPSATSPDNACWYLLADPPSVLIQLSSQTCLNKTL